jgi:WD40 repeat protein
MEMSGTCKSSGPGCVRPAIAPFRAESVLLVTTLLAMARAGSFAALLAMARVGSADPPTQSPQLCLNIAGHTAAITAMAFSPDSKFLYTAGLDKAVHVWRLPAQLAVSSDAIGKAVLAEHLWSEERTIRWSIGRGLRGSIYAMAVSPKTGELAVGGYGARGTLGDIALLDPVRGLVVNVREEHRESIMSLGFSASGKSMASIDRTGRLLLWPAAAGKPLALAPSDAEAYGPAAAQAIAASLRLRPIGIAGDRWVAAPVYSGLAGDGKLMTWQVRLYDMRSGQPKETLKTIYFGTITALDSTADARYVAAADQSRQLCIWDGQSALAKHLRSSRPIISLAFAPRGDVLAAGTACDEETGISELQIWDVAAGKVRRARSLQEPVSACAISPDGRYVAYTGGRGHELFVEQLETPQARLPIAGGREVAAVAIAGRKGESRIVYTTLPAPSGAAKARVFEPGKLELNPWGAPVPQASMTCGNWQAVVDRKNNQLTVFADGEPVGTLETDRQRQGLIHSFCWIADAQGTPLAFALGTNIQCGVYVYGLPEKKDFRLLRYFRGHHDLVTALAVAPDARTLLSGSRDGTVRCWPLTDLQNPSAIRRRWGAELVERGGLVVVASIDEYGPLYQKQVRAGDTIAKVLWLDGQTVRSQAKPGQILDRLAHLPWYEQVSFFTSRQGTARPPFNLVGGWHELLGFYATEPDWIAWTPGGYYACSAGGERLVGWQVNAEDLRLAPSFFSADKFSKVLYRPDLIRSLLKDGTVSTSMQKLHETPTHVNEISPPVIKIVSAEHHRVDEHANQIRIAATAESKDDRPLVAMQLLLDGRPYGQGRRYAAGDRSVRQRQETWFIETNPGQHLISVQAENEKGYATDEIEVNCAGQDNIKPALYCLSIGISDYPGNLRLRYGRSDAQALTAVLEKNGTEVFGKVMTKTLVDAEATKEKIEAGLQWLQKQATWRDVSVVFYAGHGMNDDSGQFFLIPMDGLPKRASQTCIADTAIKEFCQRTPGKVIVLLDACRSASIKINVNELALKLGRSDCGAIVLTSSAGYQDSLEGEEWKAGAFTRALVDGLEGRADFLRTGYVSSPYDIASYVDHVVRLLTDERQTPTCAAPKMPQFKITRATVH